MLIAAKLEGDGHDVYSVSLKGKADARYWGEAYLSDAKNKGDADLYLKDLQKWVEVKISKSYTSPQAKTSKRWRPYFLWSWNHSSIVKAAKNARFQYLVLIGINSLDPYLGKPEDFLYWVLTQEEALQIETLGDEEREKGRWFFLVDDPNKIDDERKHPWWLPDDFWKKQFRQCTQWSANSSIRVSYKEKWTKIW